jgi:tetratricopeptide (TPR) repeat protein
MHLSNDTGAAKGDSSNKGNTSSPGQFGSLRPSLSKILITIGVVQVLLLSYWVIPRVVSLYYQTRGGQIVDQILSRGQMTQWDSIACASPPISRDSTRELLVSAVGDLRRAIQFSQNDAQPHLLIGRASCMLGEPEIAIEAYQSYVNLKPNNPLGHLELGFAFEAACLEELNAIRGESRGRPEEQRCDIPEYRETMIASWTAAGITLQDFIDTGELALENGRHFEALKWFRRGTEYSPDSGTPWFYIGKIYEELERSDVSLNAYLMALELGSAESIDAIIEVFTMNGNEDALAELLEKSLDQFLGYPDRQIWWNQLGEIYRRQKDWDSAISVYEEAVTEFPDDPTLHLNLGLSYYDGGVGFEEVQSELERSIELNPENGSGYFTLARLLTLQKRYTEADIWYKLALEKNPSANRWQLARANSAREQGDFDLALQEYLAIIERSETFAPAYYELAYLYLLLEKSEDAISAIEQAIQFMGSPETEYFMRAGAIYESAGLVEKAVEAYQSALALSPQSKLAAQRIDSLISGEN